jgi:hypothetical protein
MDTGRQLLRFSIPGSITLLLAIAFFVIGRLLQHDSWAGVSSALGDNVSAVIAIFAAIPLGFIVTQVYHASYRSSVWLWPSSSGDGWVRLDRGGHILNRLPEEIVHEVETTFDLDLDTSPTALRRSGTRLGRLLRAWELSDEYRDRGEAPHLRYRARWSENWDALRAYLLIGDLGSDGAAIRSEYTFLADLFHTLGACRGGVALAWVASTVACLVYAVGGSPAGSLEAIALTSVIAAVLAGFFHRTRGITWSSAESSIVFGLKGTFKQREQRQESDNRPSGR